MSHRAGVALSSLLNRAIGIADELTSVSRHPAAILSHLLELRDQWDDPDPQVALIGASSAGKTSLLRMLLGATFLPVGRTTTTAAITMLRAGPAAVGVVFLRDRITMKAYGHNNTAPDPVVVKTLQEWAGDPGYRVLRITEITGEAAGATRSALSNAQLLERLGSDIAVGTSFEVVFEPAEPISHDLGKPSAAERFTRFLQDPVLSPRVAKTVCYLPHPLLGNISVVDTAGFSSPTAAHTDLSAAVLSRRPDHIMLLLDARKLDSVATADAVASLRPIVQDAQDYGDLTVGLTHWDRALVSHIDDRDLDARYESQADRARLTGSFLAEKREELAVILAECLGVAPRSPLAVFPLALTDRAPRDLTEPLAAMWSHVQETTSSRDPDRIWVIRCRSAAPTFEALRLECRMAQDSAQRHAADATLSRAELDQRIRGNIQRFKNLSQTADRTIALLRTTIRSQHKRLWSAIDVLAGAKQIRRFAEQTLAVQINDAALAIHTAANTQYEQLAQMLPTGTLTRPVALPPQVLAQPDHHAIRLTQRLRGKRHAVRKVWDSTAGGVLRSDLSGRDIRVAKENVKHFAGWAFQRINDHTEQWIGYVEQLRQWAVNGLRDEYEHLVTDHRIAAGSADAIARDLNRLDELARMAEDLLHELNTVRSYGTITEG